MTTAVAERPVDVRPQDIPSRASGTGLLSGASSRLLGLLLGVAVLVSLALMSIAVGAKEIGVGTVLDALFAYDDTLEDHLIVQTLRVPRTLVALLVGVALGLGGAVMQGVARNPLADPGILGVDAGAGLMVVLAIAVLGVTDLLGYVWFAFAGALVASVVVYAIGSTGREGATPVKLTLAGAAIGTLLGSLTGAVLLLDLTAQDLFRYWAVGSVAGRDLGIAAQVAPFILVGALLALGCGPALNALALGDDMAKGLGQRVGLARAVSAAGVVLLVGASTAAVGPIGFVGLVVPHVARLLTGPDYRWVLTYSMVLAPSLLLLADVLGRVVMRPAELQVGIVTAAVGAPFFVWLVRRRNLAEL